MELRKSKRYRVSVPVFFWWEQPDGTGQEGTGSTLDISSSGVAIVTDAIPGVGTRLQVEVHLPSTQTRRIGAQLRGQGRVVRIERKKGTIDGFAAEVDFQTSPPFSVISRTQSQ